MVRALRTGCASITCDAVNVTCIALCVRNANREGGCVRHIVDSIHAHACMCLTLPLRRTELVAQCLMQGVM